MKTLQVTLLLLFVLTFVLHAQEKSAEQKIIEGIYQEEVAGDLDKAAIIFNDVLKNCAGDRIICARALYHLGLVAEKKAGAPGAKKAESYYVQLIEKYPDAGDYSDLARNRLSKLRETNTFTDPRDGHKYKWVKIGNQIWMAENLAYIPWVSPNNAPLWGIWVYDYDGEDVAAARSTGNYQKFGCLYDWATAMDIDPKYLEVPWKGDPENHQGICPPGWHLPTDEEWKKLEINLGMPDVEANDFGRSRATLRTTVIKDGRAVRKVPLQTIDMSPVGRYLKTSTGWNSDGNGDGSSRFDVLPAGSRWSEASIKPGSLGYEGGFWTASEVDSIAMSFYFERKTAWIRDIGRGDDVFRGGELKTNGFSVRCVKTNSKPGDPIPSQESALAKRLVPINRQLLPMNRQQDAQAVRQQTPELLWFFKSIPGQMISHHDMVLLSTSEGLVDQMGTGDTGGLFQLHAVEISTGKLLWSTQLKSRLFGEPCFDKNIVYFSTFNRIYYGIDLNSGQIVWEYNTGSKAFQMQVVNNVLYATGREFIALDILTKKVIWTFGIENYEISGFSIDKDKIYVTIRSSKPPISPHNGQNLCALNILNGEKLWEYVAQDNRMFTRPTVDDSRVYFWHGNNYFYAINKDNGETMWRFNTGNSSGPETTVSGGNIFIQSGTSKLICVEAKEGNPSWIFSTIKRAFVKPLIYNSTVILFDNQDKCAIGVDLRTGRQLWEFPIPGSVKGGVEIENDRIIITCEDGIYCYDLKSLK